MRTGSREGFMAGHLLSTVQRNRKLLCSFHLRKLSPRCLGLRAVNENQVKANEPVINKSVSSCPKLNNELKEIYSIHLKKLFTFPVATCY